MPNPRSTPRSMQFVLALLAASLPAGHAAAQAALPAVNLGLTSFLDGGPPAGPGFYYQQYLQYFTSSKLADDDGHDSGVLDDLDVWVSLNQFLYQSDQPLLFGGKWGIDVIVPIVGIDVDPAPGVPLSANDTGLGDLLIGPYLQWDPIMGKNGPLFMHRIELQTILPTGKYDDDKVLNPGSNHFSFNPYWAATLWLEPQWTLSWRLHYLWNGRNDDPLAALPVSDVQPGQAIHANFATSYELIPNRLHAGINGYFLKQITDSEVGGVNEDAREQVLGIGPGAVWHFSKDDHLFFNLYFETLAENRPEGTRAVLRWTHHF